MNTTQVRIASIATTATVRRELPSPFPPPSGESAARPVSVHQPSYSMLNRWIETEGLLDAAAELGIGVIGFTALAQGLLTDRYLDGVPEDSRAARDPEFDKSWLNDEMISKLRGLNEIASRRGQSLAQLALAWGLRDERVTSLVIGASSVNQLEQNAAALDNSGPPAVARE
jgi:L-glyceraldehyde 3-phosphate reductase